MEVYGPTPHSGLGCTAAGSATCSRWPATIRDDDAGVRVDALVGEPPGPAGQRRGTDDGAKAPPHPVLLYRLIRTTGANVGSEFAFGEDDMRAWKGE